MQSDGPWHQWSQWLLGAGGAVCAAFDDAQELLWTSASEQTRVSCVLVPSCDKYASTCVGGGDKPIRQLLPVRGGVICLSSAAATLLSRGCLRQATFTPTASVQCTAVSCCSSPSSLLSIGCDSHSLLYTFDLNDPSQSPLQTIDLTDSSGTSQLHDHPTNPNLLLAGTNSGQLMLVDCRLRSNQLHTQAHAGSITSMTCCGDFLVATSGVNARSVNPYDKNAPVKVYPDPLIKLFDLRVLGGRNDVLSTIPFPNTTPTPGVRGTGVAFLRFLNNRITNSTYLSACDSLGNLYSFDILSSNSTNGGIGSYQNLSNNAMNRLTSLTTSPSGDFLCTGWSNGSVVLSSNIADVTSTAKVHLNGAKNKLSFPMYGVPVPPISVSAFDPSPGNKYQLLARRVEDSPESEQQRWHEGGLTAVNTARKDLFSTWLPSKTSHISKKDLTLIVAPKPIRKIHHQIKEQVQQREFIGYVTNHDNLALNSFIYGKNRNFVYEVADPRFINASPTNSQNNNKTSPNRNQKPLHYTTNRGNSNNVNIPTLTLNNTTSTTVTKIPERYRFSCKFHNKSKHKKGSHPHSIPSFYNSSVYGGGKEWNDMHDQLTGLEPVLLRINSNLASRTLSKNCATSSLIYVNSVLQLVFSMKEVRNCLKSHLCLNNTENGTTLCCLLCELRFLFQMMEDTAHANHLAELSKKKKANEEDRVSISAVKELGPCQPKNFLRVFRQMPEAKACGLFNISSSSDPNEKASLFYELLMHYIAKNLMNDSQKELISFSVIEECECSHNHKEKKEIKHATLLTLNSNDLIGSEEKDKKIVFSDIVEKSLSQKHDVKRKFCSTCQDYVPISVRSTLTSLPTYLAISCNMKTSEVGEVWRTEEDEFVSPHLLINLAERRVCEKDKDMNQDGYDLVGVVSGVHDADFGFNKKDYNGHLATHISLTDGDKYEEDWVILNDVRVRRTILLDAISFHVPFKTPVVFLYKKRLGGPSDVVEPNIAQIPASVFNTISKSHKHSVNESFERLSEVPGRGDLVAIDTEFVNVEMEQAVLRTDGKRVIVKESRQALARVSAICGQSGRVFIDDYIIPTEPVVDYLTRFSGLIAEDLDVECSKHHLVTLEETYLKLRFLCDAGVIFIGHGLDKDFRIANLVVPADQIYDTVEIYSLPASRKISLRFLIGFCLETEIQQSTHDSIEDARSALLLYQNYAQLSPEQHEQLLNRIYKEGRRANWKIADLQNLYLRN